MMKVSSEKSANSTDLFLSDPFAPFMSIGDLIHRNNSVRKPVAAKRSNVQPILYKRINAAAALDVSPSTFDSWVANGILPPGRSVGGLKMWSVRELETAAEDLISSSNAQDKKIKEETELARAFDDFKG